MELIDPAKLKRVTEARKIVADLQVRLLAREQALDDLARAFEIAQYSGQYQLVESFRIAANEQLEDRLIMPAAGENEDLKIRIFE
jgi:hypothetical protein